MDHLFPLYLLFRKSLGSTICGFEKCKYLWGIHGFLGFLQCHDGWGTSVLSLFFQQACHPGCQCIDGYLYYFKEDGSQAKGEIIEENGIKYYYEPGSGILASGRYLQVGDDQWMYFKQDGSLAIGQVRASIQTSFEIVLTVVYEECRIFFKKGYRYAHQDSISFRI